MINLSILIPSWFPYVTTCRKKFNCTSITTAGHHWHFFSYKNPQNFYSHQLIYSDNILLPAILLCNEAWNLFWSSILTFMDLFAFSNSACFYNVLFCFTTAFTHSKPEKVILHWWGHRLWFLLLFWVLHAHELGPFMPNSSVFIFFNVARPLQHDM